MAPPKKTANRSSAIEPMRAGVRAHVADAAEQALDIDSPATGSGIGLRGMTHRQTVDTASRRRDHAVRRRDADQRHRDPAECRSEDGAGLADALTGTRHPGLPARGG